jgi:hypothetical protein
MPRFVLLYHECPPNYERPSHWDLMLESGATLRTWALERLPRDWRAIQSLTAKTYPTCASIAQSNAVAAAELGTHRPDYLQLEGPLSGDRGTVIRVAAGSYRSEIEQPDRWRVALAGNELTGYLTLTRLVPDSSQWTLEYEHAG